MHLVQKFFRERKSSSLTYYRIEATIGTQCGLALIYPVYYLARDECFSAVEAATEFASNYFTPVSCTMFVGLSNVCRHLGPRQFHVRDKLLKTALILEEFFHNLPSQKAGSSTAQIVRTRIFFVWN